MATEAKRKEPLSVQPVADNSNEVLPAVVHNEKLAIELRDYIDVLARQQPFTRDLKVDASKVIPALANAWPDMPEWDAQAYEIWRRIEVLVQTVDLVPGKPVMVRVAASASSLTPAVIPEANETAAIATFDSREGVEHITVLTPYEDPPDMDDLKIPAGLMVMCAVEPAATGWNVDNNVENNPETKINTLTSRNRDRVLAGDSPDPEGWKTALAGLPRYTPHQLAVDALGILGPERVSAGAVPGALLTSAMLQNILNRRREIIANQQREERERAEKYAALPPAAAAAGAAAGVQPQQQERRTYPHDRRGPERGAYFDHEANADTVGLPPVERQQLARLARYAAAAESELTQKDAAELIAYNQANPDAPMRPEAFLANKPEVELPTVEENASPFAPPAAAVAAAAAAETVLDQQNVPSQQEEIFTPPATALNIPAGTSPITIGQAEEGTIVPAGINQGSPVAQINPEYPAVPGSVLSQEVLQSAYGSATPVPVQGQVASAYGAEEFIPPQPQQFQSAYGAEELLPLQAIQTDVAPAGNTLQTGSVNPPAGQVVGLTPEPQQEQPQQAPASSYVPSGQTTDMPVSSGANVTGTGTASTTSVSGTPAGETPEARERVPEIQRREETSSPPLVTGGEGLAAIGPHALQQPEFAVWQQPFRQHVWEPYRGPFRLETQEQIRKENQQPVHTHIIPAAAIERTAPPPVRAATGGAAAAHARENHPDLGALHHLEELDKGLREKRADSTSGNSSYVEKTAFHPENGANYTFGDHVRHFYEGLVSPAENQSRNTLSAQLGRNAGFMARNFSQGLANSAVAARGWFLRPRIASDDERQTIHNEMHAEKVREHSAELMAEAKPQPHQPVPSIHPEEPAPGE